MELIDTHCHLFAEEFDDDREIMLQRAIDAGVKYFLLPNIDAESIPALNSLSENHPDICLPMMGLHPTSVKADYKEQLGVVKMALDHNSFIAIGEIGLDYYWDVTYKAQQQEVFRQQLQWAKARKLPVAIHTRNSFDDAFRIVQEEKDASLTGVFHCFSGSTEEAEKVMSVGFMMGIGGVATFKNGGLDKVLPFVPMEYIILETDAPYLAPVPHRGKRNESSYLPLVAQRLADIKQTRVQEVAAATTANAKRLFHLPE